MPRQTTPPTMRNTTHSRGPLQALLLLPKTHTLRTVVKKPLCSTMLSTMLPWVKLVRLCRVVLLVLLVLQVFQAMKHQAMARRKCKLLAWRSHRLRLRLRAAPLCLLHRHLVELRVATLA